MPDNPDAGRPSGLRSKLPELMVEGISVAFAVLLALAVDEWRETRSNHQLALRAEESVLAEVQGNLRILEDKSHSRDSLVAYTRDKRRALVQGEELENININFNPALLTRTAWETAQLTRALAFMDYDKVARIGRLYEIQSLYEESEDALVRMLAGLESLNWDEPTEALDQILPVLVRVDTFGDLLTAVYGNVLEHGFVAELSDEPDEAAAPDEGASGEAPSDSADPGTPRR